MKVIWSPRAYERVIEIGEYIVQQGRPDAAANVVDGILRSVRRLQRFPESGRMLPELPREELREVIHGVYRVIYRLDSELSRW